MEQELASCEKTPVFEILLNLVLVSEGGRPATLIEFNKFKNDERDKYQGIIMEFIDKVKLVTFPDPTTIFRVFVTREPLTQMIMNEDDIGTLLGFYGVGHRFDDVCLDRIAGSIIEVSSGEQIYAEICEKNKIILEKFQKFLSDKVSLFNSIMYRLNLPYSFAYQIDEMPSITPLMKKYINREYVMRYLDTYLMILTNTYYANTLFASNPQLIMTKFAAFKFIMSKITDQSMDQFYHGFIPTSKRHSQLINLLKKMDELIVTMDEDYTNVLYECIFNHFYQLRRNI